MIWIISSSASYKEIFLIFFTFGFLVTFTTLQFVIIDNNNNNNSNNNSSSNFLYTYLKSTYYMLINTIKRYLSKVINFNSKMIKYLQQDEAIQIDQELFNEYKFSVDQLMELAGLSVASVIAKVYDTKKNSPILVITGPGNNGGDGLVAARHLKLFGFSNVTLLSAKKPTKPLFINLTLQAELNDVSISYDPSQFQNTQSLGVIVDSLFGFSFKPPVRPDFQPLMEILTKGFANQVPIVAVDIPSGWDVENGPPTSDPSLYFMPDTLVSLTAPKACAKFFKGQHHYLGGRFVPNKLAQKYAINLPDFPGTECIAKL